MGLKEYNKKRDFSKTKEPKGKVSTSSKYKNLFIIQKHAASHLHYDFRIELNGTLKSWAVPKGPCLDPDVKRLAMHVEDHPVEYGTFEGIIPKGEYGGGTVMLWDKGKWVCENENPTKAYLEGHLTFYLEAEKLKGKWSLIRFKKEEKSWFLVKAKDKYAKPLSTYDITLKKPNSVLTKHSIDEIAESYKAVWHAKEGKSQIKKKVQKKEIKLPNDLSPARFPHEIFPQLATLVDKPPSGEEWLHEIKLDGYRILAFKKNNEIRLMSRNHKDWTAIFPSVKKALLNLTSKDFILDGEIVLLNKENKSDFQLLQNSIKENHNQPFIYYLFDIIYFDHYQLTSKPLIERKKILQSLIPNNATLQYSDHIIGEGDKVFAKAEKMQLEGIISKEINSLYEQKRSKNWLKIKCLKSQEFVIGGYTKPKGSRQHFGSLFLGVYDENKHLKFCGNVGTGFNQASLKEINQLLIKNKSNKNPFDSNPPGVTTANWVKPNMVAEVAFSEWTADGNIRHPSFKGIRIDKKPEDIRKEMEKSTTKINSQSKSATSSAKKKTSSKNNFKLSNSKKILYKEDNITKEDLANYYHEIKDWILPFIINRPLTLVRCPESYQHCFYQKHIKPTTPNTLFNIPITSKSGIEEYIYLKNFAGLLSLVQMGVLEIHPWGSKIKQLETPDMITIDLDPDPNLPWKVVVETAFEVRSYFNALKLKSFVKTTGGKGLHVVIPIKPLEDWETVKNFTHLFVKQLEKSQPAKFISQMNKSKRKGKIFIDYLRNSRGATAVSAYSTRARIHAPISTPIAWEELTDHIEDTQYTIFTLPKRLKKIKKDPWADFFNIKQKLPLD